MRPLLGWLLGGRQVFLVVLTTTKVLGCFMLSTGPQVCVCLGVEECEIFGTYDGRFSGTTARWPGG